MNQSLGTLSGENVERKQRAALAWCDQANELHGHLRADLHWNHVLLGESIVRDSPDGRVAHAPCGRASTDHLGRCAGRQQEGHLPVATAERVSRRRGG